MKTILISAIIFLLSGNFFSQYIDANKNSKIDGKDIVQMYKSSVDLKSIDINVINLYLNNKSNDDNSINAYKVI